MMMIMRRVAHKACSSGAASSSAVAPVPKLQRGAAPGRHARTTRPRRRQVQALVVAPALDGTSPSSQGLLAQEIRSMPPPEVADTLWAYVLTHGYDPGICATVATVVLEDMNKFSPATMTAILSAFAQVQHVDRDFVVVACGWMSQPYHLVELDTGTLTQAGWSIAMLAAQGVVRVEEEEEVQNLITALARQAQRRVGNFAPEDLARLLAAFGELNVPPPQLFLQSASDRLTEFVLPLSQLEPSGLAQVTWALARLGGYNRELFDLAQRDMQRKAHELSWQALAQAVWAFGAVRDQDAKHRAAYDVNFFATLADQANKLILADLAPPASSTAASSTAAATSAAATGGVTDAATFTSTSNPVSTTTPTASTATPAASTANPVATTTPTPAASTSATNLSSAAAHHANSSSNGHSAGGDSSSAPEAKAQGGEAAAAAAAGGVVGGAIAPPVHAPSLLTMLLTYASVSHSDDALFRQAGRWFARYISAGEGGAQDLVVLAFAYGRMKKAAPELMLAAAGFLPQVVGQLDGDDLVHLASWGPATSLHNETLFRRVIEEALTRCSASPTALSADQLLDLARCCAAVMRNDEAHYAQAQQALLKAVNAAHLNSEMEEMSTHCGATAPDTGLQK